MRILALISCVGLAASAGGGTMVTVTPLFWSGQRYPGYVVQCTNASGRSVSKLEYVRQSQALRIDGVLHERLGIAGSFIGSTEIRDGATFAHVMFLGDAPPTPSDLATPVGEYVSSNWGVSINAGRHRISFRCGPDWSDDVGFVWAQ